MKPQVRHMKRVCQENANRCFLPEDSRGRDSDNCHGDSNELLLGRVIEAKMKCWYLESCESRLASARPK